MTDRRSTPFRTICATLALAGCASYAPSAPGLPEQRIAEIVASPDRSAADRTNDLRRKPVPMYTFIGIRPGMVALDVSAGGGYTTELLARTELTARTALQVLGRWCGGSRSSSEVSALPPSGIASVAANVQ